MSNKIKFTDKECASLLIGVIKQAMSNRDLAYISSVGAEYSHLNDEGKLLILKTVETVFTHLVRNEQDLLEEKLKEKFMKDLAGK